MEDNNFSVVSLTDKTPGEVFNAVNDVTKWWTENVEGNSRALNDEFSVRFGDVHYSKQKLVEVVPDEKVVWLVTESKLNFLKNKSEWTGTKISFEISQRDTKTELRFTHAGLVPGIECFDACSNAWGGYERSLMNLINSGKGEPDKKMK